jgi:hypothetical protein
VSSSPVDGSSAPAAGTPGDAERIAAAACQQDPGLPPETAALLAKAALPLLEEVGADAPEIARRLMAANPDVGATPANAVAIAAARAAGSGPADA